MAPGRSNPIKEIIEKQAAKAGVEYSPAHKCYVHTARKGAPFFRFSGLTKLFIDTLVPKRINRRAKGYIGGISSLERGTRVDRALTEYVERGTIPKVDGEIIRQFASDVKALGYSIVATQALAWNERDLGLASGGSTGSAKPICTAADVVLLHAARQELAIVEVKTGTVGAGLDVPLKGNNRLVPRQGPFKNLRVEVTKALQHMLQALCTSQLFCQAHAPLVKRLPVQRVFVVYVDRPGPVVDVTKGNYVVLGGLKCEWRRVDVAPFNSEALLELIA